MSSQLEERRTLLRRQLRSLGMPAVLQQAHQRFTGPTPDLRWRVASGLQPLRVSGGPAPRCVDRVRQTAVRYPANRRLDLRQCRESVRHTSQRLIGVGHQLPIAKNETLSRSTSLEKIGELFAVPTELPVVPERCPSSRDPVIFGVPGCDEVRDRFQSIYPEVHPLEYARSIGSRTMMISFASVSSSAILRRAPGIER